MKKENTGTITRQSLYMAMLICVTVGFILGAAYTSFKLAEETIDGNMQTGSAPAPIPGAQTAGPAAAAPDVDARVAELETILCSRTWG